MNKCNTELKNEGLLSRILRGNERMFWLGFLSAIVIMMPLAAFMFKAQNDVNDMQKELISLYRNKLNSEHTKSSYAYDSVLAPVQLVHEIADINQRRSAHGIPTIDVGVLSTALDYYLINCNKDNNDCVKQQN